MTTSICQNALYGLTAVLLGMAVNGIAQEPNVTMAVPATACSGSAPCPDPPVLTAMQIPLAMEAQVGIVSTGGMAFALRDNAEVVKNQPYQAQAVTEVKQTLADGSHIDQTTTATVARDSDGRTVRIQKLSTMGPWKSSSNSSQANGPTLTSIFDPVAQTHTDFTSDSKVAHVLPMPTPPAGGAKGQVAGFAMAVSDSGPREAGPVAFAVQGHFDAAEAGTNPNVKTESLGAKTIESTPVTGTKTTNTIPAGTIGNDKDILVTRETWYSSDLKLVIQSTQTDPRFGETTYSLTNIQRSEPDSALFQPPSDYTIVKVPVTVQTR